MLLGALWYCGDVTLDSVAASRGELATSVAEVFALAPGIALLELLTTFACQTSGWSRESGKQSPIVEKAPC
jgi:hypothetical protein